MAGNKETLHNKMVGEVAGIVDPAVPRYWRSFTYRLADKLQRRDINNFKSFEDICQKLMDDEIIGYGNYTYISDILQQIGLQKYSRIVMEYEQSIQDANVPERKAEEKTTGEKHQLESSVPHPKKMRKFTQIEEAYFRKIEDDTHYVWPLCAYMKAVESVGIIRAAGFAVGTGFRVGKKYVMTAEHVISIIKYEKQLNVDDERVQIQFGFIRDDPTFKNYFFATELFRDENLDCSILELKDEQCYPPSLKLDPDLSDKGICDASILGHPSGEKMKRDPGILLLPPDSQELRHKLTHLHEWGRNYQKSEKSGYEEALRQTKEKVLFDCTFTHGASGSPAVTTTSTNPRDPVCVMMLLRGFPDFYFKLPEEERKKIPKDHLLEQGLRMSALKDVLETSNKPLLSEIFDN